MTREKYPKFTSPSTARTDPPLLHKSSRPLSPNEGRVQCWRGDHLAHRVRNIYYLALDRQHLPTPDLGRQAAVAGWAPGQERDPRGSQERGPPGRHPSSPALVLGNLGRRHGLDTGTDGGAGGHLAAREGPAMAVWNLRARNGSNEAPEWGHRVAACPGQALGPGTAESSFQHRHAPLPGPRPHMDTTGHPSAQPPARDSAVLSRPASGHPKAGGCHLHPQHEQTTFPRRQPVPTHDQGRGCPPAFPADSRPKPQPLASPPTHTPRLQGPSSQHVSTRGAPPPASALPPTHQPGGTHWVPTDPATWKCRCSGSLRHHPPQEPSQAFVPIALLA